MLTSLSGLGNLTKVAGAVYILNCDSLTDLSGLESLHTVTGTVHIGRAADENDEVEEGGNAALTSLHGLSALTTVGSLFVSSNDSLESLDGLGAMSTLEVTQDLEISKNPTLSSIAGLDAVSSVGGSLSIHDNAALLQSDAESLAMRLGIPCTDCDGNKP